MATYTEFRNNTFNTCFWHAKQPEDLHGARAGLCRADFGEPLGLEAREEPKNRSLKSLSQAPKETVPLRNPKP